MKKIKLFDPIIGKPEENAVKKVLQSHYWSSGSGGGKVFEFENKFNIKYKLNERTSIYNIGEFYSLQGQKFYKAKIGLEYKL